jgi:hypothetical protein
MWIRLSKAFREASYQEQLKKLQRLQHATSIEDLQRSVRETGIRWYVAHPGDPNTWPAEFRDHPAFESNGYRVYDMQRCFDLHDDLSSSGSSIRNVQTSRSQVENVFNASNALAGLTSGLNQESRDNFEYASTLSCF